MEPSAPVPLDYGSRRAGNSNTLAAWTLTALNLAAGLLALVCALGAVLMREDLGPHSRAVAVGIATWSILLAGGGLATAIAAHLIDRRGLRLRLIRVVTALACLAAASAFYLCRYA